MTTEQYRILILISDTGGGHRASANALSAAIHHKYPKLCKISILDMWTVYGVWPFNSFVPAYKYLCDRPTYWSLLYDSSKYHFSREFISASGYMLCGPQLKKAFESIHPDLVCSMHPLCQAVPLKLLDEICYTTSTKRVPFVTVVTDLGGAHPTWFSRDVDLCFVPSEAVRSVAEEEGLKTTQIRQYGLPLRKPFWTPEIRSKAQVRESLGLSAISRTCLVVGGGDGVGDVRTVVHCLFNVLSRDRTNVFQIVVICGSNAQLAQDLRADFKKHLTADVSLQPCDSITKSKAFYSRPTTPHRTWDSIRPSFFESQSSDSPTFASARLQTSTSCPDLGKLGQQNRSVPLRDSILLFPTTPPPSCELPTCQSLRPKRATLATFRNDVIERRVASNRQRTVMGQQKYFPPHPAASDHQSEGWGEWFTDRVTSFMETTPAADRKTVGCRGDHGGVQRTCLTSVVVQEFVSNMDEWMSASNLIITKAGPGTISEACTRGLPVLLYCYLPGQEEGNVEFVSKHRFGGYCSDPKKIAVLAHQLLVQPAILKALGAKARRAIDPSATLKIAEDIVVLLKEENNPSRKNANVENAEFS